MNTQPQQQQGYPQSYDQSYAYGYPPPPGAPTPGPPTHQPYIQGPPAPVVYASPYPQPWHGHQATPTPSPAPMPQQVYPPQHQQHPQLLHHQPQHHHQQPQQQRQQQPLPQQQHYPNYPPEPGPPIPGYTPAHDTYTRSPSAPVNNPPGAYVQPAPPPAPQQQAPPQYMPPNEEQAPEAGSSGSSALLQTPSQPMPAPVGQTLGAYAYPGPAQQQQLTPQQVAQEAIARTMASMAAQQPPQQENRRGYLYGTLIGEMEKARLERAALKNENYVRRKDEIARRKRLGLPLDGLVEKKSAQNGGGGGATAGGGGAPKPPPRSQQPLGGAQNRAGIGTAASKVQNTSVYIMGLPSDITQAKIELIFSQHGKVKRVKIYRDDAGQPKGDGLVTYTKPASVDLSVAKLNGHEISVGYPILVSVANFNKTETVEPEADAGAAVAAASAVAEPHQDPEWDSSMLLAPEPAAGDESTALSLPPLPEECQAKTHPVVVLRNVYTRDECDADPNFFDDLEADMLMECVKFGTVVRVATPEAPGYFGSVCITFDSCPGAQECVKAMHGRWFDQRQIEAVLMGKVDDTSIHGDTVGTEVSAAGGEPGGSEGKQLQEQQQQQQQQPQQLQQQQLQLQQQQQQQQQQEDGAKARSTSFADPTDIDKFLESV